MNFYYNPLPHGLEVVGEIQWDRDDYGFDITVVYRDLEHENPVFLYGEDVGCSCPSPFETQIRADLKEITSLGDFRDHLYARAGELEPTAREPGLDVVALLEKLYHAGLR